MPGPEMTESWLNEVFMYHKPEGDDPKKYEALRAGAKFFARVVMENCPPSADRTTAIRKIREAVMTANASIALKGIA